MQKLRIQSSCYALHQRWGRSLIFDLKIKDPSDFGDLFDDLDHTRRSDLFNGDLDLRSHVRKIILIP